MVEVRQTASAAEDQLSLDFYNTVWPWDSITMDEVDSFRASVLDYVDMLAYVDGEPVGSAASAVMPARPAVAFVLVTVPRVHRRRGAGSALLDACTAWAAERRLGTLEGPVPEDDPEAIAFAERRGFAEVGRNGRLVLELSSIEAPSVDAPPGVEVVTWAERPDLARGMYEVAVEAFPDIPGEEDDEMESFDDWLEHHMSGSGDKPEATFVAVAGDEVVGYAKFSLTAARPEVASHDMTGVKRAWRGRGVARALKHAEIAWAKSAGFERLVTQNEMRNAPIRHLNERLGYKPAPGRIYVHKPLLAGVP